MQPRYHHTARLAPGRTAAVTRRIDPAQAAACCLSEHRGIRPAPEHIYVTGRLPQPAGRRAFRTVSYSVLLFVYLPTPEPPGSGNAQAEPGINLPVGSQTYLRAKP